MTTCRLHIQCHYANSPSTSASLCSRSSSVGLHNCLTIEFLFCFISCNYVLFCFISRNYVPFLSDFLQPYFLFVLLSLTFLFDHLPKIPIKTSVKLLSTVADSHYIPRHSINLFTLYQSSKELHLLSLNSIKLHSITVTDRHRYQLQPTHTVLEPPRHLLPTLSVLCSRASATFRHTSVHLSVYFHSYTTPHVLVTYSNCVWDIVTITYNYQNAVSISTSNKHYSRASSFGQPNKAH